MGAIRYGILGTGWRANFYTRIAKLVPESFSARAIFTRNREKAEALSRSEAAPVLSDLDRFLDLDMDFVVLCVKRGHVAPYLQVLADRGVPVLCETPPGESVEELSELWFKHGAVGTKLQVAEQYFLQPLYAAWLEAIRRGLIGEVSNLTISALHGYHAASIIRKVLSAGFEAFSVEGSSFEFPATSTMSRGGVDLSGELRGERRDRAEIRFAGGTVAFYDFADLQYRSLIRTRQLNIQGTRGEIDDLEARYLLSDNSAVLQRLTRRDLGMYNNQEWSHEGLWLGETALYRSPLPMARLNDDELAVATCLLRMADYVHDGQCFYPLAEALQDTYLALLMEQAWSNPGTRVESGPQPWQERQH